jgi:hypothetical protein
MTQAALQLWQRHLTTVEENRGFVDCQILDEISGTVMLNKHRKITTIVTEIINGCPLLIDDIIRKFARRKQRSPSVTVAAKIMQHIILRGFKELPWNEMRTNLVICFFGEAFLPITDPFRAIISTGIQHTVLQPHEQSSFVDNTQIVQQDSEVQRETRNVGCIIPRVIFPSSYIRPDRIKRYIKHWRTPKGAKLFWRQVMWFIRKKGINIKALFDVFLDEATERQNREGSTKKKRNNTKILVQRLFVNRGSTDNFKDHLAIALKTENVTTIINLIRSRLKLRSLGYNLVPSIREIQRSSAQIFKYFGAICKPERTFSGFRLDLVICVKFAAYLLLNKTDLTDVEIDIWGDGCEIGGVEVTRLVFRLLNVAGNTDAEQKFSAQSSKAVFCFAGMYFNYYPSCAKHCDKGGVV